MKPSGRASVEKPRASTNGPTLSNCASGTFLCARYAATLVQKQLRGHVHPKVAPLARLRSYTRKKKQSDRTSKKTRIGVVYTAGSLRGTGRGSGRGAGRRTGRGIVRGAGRSNGVFEAQNKQTSETQFDHSDFSKPKNTNKHPTNKFAQVVFGEKHSQNNLIHFL